MKRLQIEKRKKRKKESDLGGAIKMLGLKYRKREEESGWKSWNTKKKGDENKRENRR